MNREEIKELIDYCISNLNARTDFYQSQEVLKSLLLEALILDSDNVIKKMKKL